MPTSSTTSLPSTVQQDFLGITRYLRKEKRLWFRLYPQNPHFEIDCITPLNSDAALALFNKILVLRAFKLRIEWVGWRARKSTPHHDVHPLTQWKLAGWGRILCVCVFRFNFAIFLGLFLRFRILVYFSGGWTIGFDEDKNVWAADDRMADIADVTIFYLPHPFSFFILPRLKEL